MKHLLTILAVAMTAVVMQVAGAADVSWTGGGGVVDWNAATWSTGTPPGATDTVTFTPNTTYADFTVTPPADFVGKIVIANRSGYNLAGSYFQGRIKIVNSNNAVFSIGGAGSIEAYDGIESMIDATYAGDIEIPAGVSFAPSAAFPAGASFVGIGTFTPATSAQLEAAQRFRGKLDLSKVDAISVKREHTIFMGRDLVLGAGVAVNDAGAEVVVSKLEHLADASGWTLNGNNSEALPVFDANGKLKFPGAKSAAHSAYFNRRFKKGETFLVKFKYCRQKVTGCDLGVVTSLGIRVGELTDYPTATDATSEGALPSHTYGIGSYAYTWTANKYLFRLYDQAKYPQVGSRQNHIIASSCGFSLNAGVIYDVAVFCHKGIMTISMEGDGACRTWTTDVSKAFNDDERGVMFGFSDLSDAWDAQSMEYWDFKGWVASEDNGQWLAADSSFTLSPDNYYLWLDYAEGGGTNSFRGASVLDANGRLPVSSQKNWYGAGLSKGCVTAGKKFILDWATDVGTSAWEGDAVTFALSPVADSDIKTLYGDPDVADGSGYGLESRQYILHTSGTFVKFQHAYLQDLCGLSTRNKTGAVADRYDGTCLSGASVFRTKNTTNVYRMCYDGLGTVDAYAANSSNPQTEYAFTIAHQIATDRRFEIVGFASWTYLQTFVHDVKLRYWNESYVATPYVNVSAPAGVTTTMSGAGKYAPIERIVLDDAAARVAFTGSVSFGGELEIVVPDAFLKTVRTKATLVDLSAATVSGSLPTALSLVDSTGAAIPMRGRTLTVDAGGVTLSGPTGLIILFK